MERQMKGLLGELERLLEASEQGDLNVSLNLDGLCGAEREAAGLLNLALGNYLALAPVARLSRKGGKTPQDEAQRGGWSSDRRADWYKSILESITLPISVTDADMILTFVNAAARQFFSDRDDRLVGQPCNSWGVPICDTDDCSIERAKRGLKQTFFKYKGISCQVDTETILDAAGEAQGFIEILHDITNVEKMARQAADAASEAKSAFLATMSHEIRTPLNAIIGMTAIGRKTADVVRKNYALERIEESSTHLLGIINDILDMSKIEANKLELSPAEMNVDQMLHKVLTVIGGRVEEKRQTLSVNVGSDVPRFIVCDDQRLTQVITNLLSNAVKFSLEGGEIRLNVSLEGKEGDLCELKFEVIDNGIGISSEQQSRLFNMFTQAESGISREFGGTGLGLAISRCLVEMMDGKIWAESELGQGSRFMFTVRVPSGVKNMRLLLHPGTQWKNVNVLAVDSAMHTRQYFKDIFERLEVPCETAADGLGAWSLIERQGAFDVYFISRCLPDLDGVELARRIKARGEGGAVALISSSDWETLQEAVQSAGADKGLLQPILSSALVDFMNECRGSDTPDVHGQSGEFAGKTLLLAEDMAINREIVVSLLEDTGLIIDCARNGLEALTMLEAAPERYDAVLMDMQMPVMDGLEATRRIRALTLPRCSKIPIIAMTANVFKDDIENCLAAGMNGHIGKPINLDRMLDAMRNHMFADMGQA